MSSHLLTCVAPAAGDRFVASTAAVRSLFPQGGTVFLKVIWSCLSSGVLNYSCFVPRLSKYDIKAFLDLLKKKTTTVHVATCS